MSHRNNRRTTNKFAISETTAIPQIAVLHMSPSETKVWSPTDPPPVSPTFNPHCSPAMAPSAISPLAQSPYTGHYLNGYGNINRKVFSKKLIRAALKERIDSIDQDNCEPGGEDAFFVADLGEIYRQHMRWKKNLPRVEPFYGMYNSSTPSPPPSSSLV